jgi:hypothetical protein
MEVIGKSVIALHWNGASGPVIGAASGSPFSTTVAIPNVPDARVGAFPSYRTAS